MIENIGIVGGGQLGRMLTEAAQPLGFRVTVIDPAPHCPAAQVGAEQFQAGLKDETALDDLAERSDVITWEIEHVNAKRLEHLAHYGHVAVRPDPSTLETIQDKYFQKVFLKNKGLPVADFNLIPDNAFLSIFTNKAHLGTDIIIKAARGAYDGRGNLPYTGQTVEELQESLGENIYAEKRVDFEKELSVIAARDIEGNIAVYPTVETVHKDSICHTVLSPARIDSQMDNEAQEIAHETLRHLKGAGVFAIEMFATDTGVLINEIAPRVHNSGHHTIEANVTSQFEQHIRAITGMALGSTAMRVPAAVMINILGKREEALTREGLEDVLAMPDTHPHFYGKSSRAARKIGHITVLGNTTEEVMTRAQHAREALVV